ncbi:hypothetical protein BB934_38335 (plasmid) [Microvirga ossetica]|uniref:DUF2141 domain-containing protein n=1 Tax=Microvirga ossetica TaxID=1882682 RepID=A0A1B2EXR9_9HYPH|nr:DUF2141 domain-containing protein [Microvirga ossetica]ANY84779.1 hypothetical protein BB934_38335 [Microvirga ossetica]
MFTVALFLYSDFGASATTLHVDAFGIQIGAGTVFAGLCVGGLDERSCQFGQTSPGRMAAIRFTFPELLPGTYAIAIFQDLNGNGRLDRTPLGLPLEPYGFSNDAGRLRRPTFAGASIQVGDQDLRIAVRLTVIPQAR